jgi:membrane-associated protease RseP (regulator of RpoE activity)
MSRIAPKLLTALFVLGCGSGAMASPNRGQWTDNTGGYQTTGTGDQNQPPQGYPPQGYPSQGGYRPQGSSPSQSYPSHGSSPSQGYPSQGYPSQGGYPDQGSSQPPEQEQDEDTLETETLEAAGQSHLGVTVMGLTSELRQFFGVASDRGVLVARVEPSSPAARAGIQVGDVVVRIGPQVVRSGDDIMQALAARQGGRIRISVVRQGHPIHLVAVLPGASNSQLNNQNQPIGPSQNQL